MVGTPQLEMYFSEKGVGMLMNTELNVTWHCVLAVRMAGGALGCSRTSVTSRLSEMILPLHTAQVGLLLEPSFGLLSC